jgi:hypothetical protein
MISAKGIKRAKLIPASTKLFGGIIGKSTYISSNHLETPQLIIKIISDRSAKKLPSGTVISCPMY